VNVDEHIPLPHGREPWPETCVSKTLWPPQAGTLRWRRRHGPRLVCVRYRHSPDGEYRYTTVELLVDHARIRHKGSGRPTHEVQLGQGEQELARQLKAAGACWDRNAQVWRASLKLLRQLRLSERARRRQAE